MTFIQPPGGRIGGEAACYAFTAAEIDLIEEATEALHRLCIEAVDRIVTAGDLGRLQIPETYHQWVAYFVAAS